MEKYRFRQIMTHPPGEGRPKARQRWQSDGFQRHCGAGQDGRSFSAPGEEPRGGGSGVETRQLVGAIDKWLFYMAEIWLFYMG